MTDPGNREAGVDFILDDFPPAPGQALLLVFGAVLVGILTGLLGIAFLVVLKTGDSLRLTLTAELRTWPVFFGGLTLSVLVAGAMLVEGSPEDVARDPQVKAVYLGEGADV